MAASQASSVALQSTFVRSRLEKLFFPSMALLILASVLLGFARTFFLAPIYHYHLPNLLVAVHGIVFVSWIVLFAVQTSLVAGERADLHKKLGVFGAVLVGLVFIMAYAVMLEGLRRGIAFRGQDDALALALDVIGINVSVGMFAAGLLLRRNPVSHKRLMLFGTLGMLGPAIARWPFEFIAAKPPMVGLVLQSFSLATIIFDLFTRRRIHRTTWIGAATLFLVPLIAVPLSTTPFWHHLLASLKQFLTRF